MFNRDINWEIWSSLTLNLQHLWLWKMNESKSNWIEDTKLLQSSYYTAPSVRLECWINNFTLWLTYEMMFRIKLIGYEGLWNSNIMHYLMIVLLLIYQSDTLATAHQLIYPVLALMLENGSFLENRSSVWKMVWRKCNNGKNWSHSKLSNLSWITFI